LTSRHTGVRLRSVNGGGKIYHGGFPDPPLWQDYFPSQQNNKPDDPMPPNRPINGIPNTAQFDWGPVDAPATATARKSFTTTTKTSSNGPTSPATPNTPTSKSNSQNGSPRPISLHHSTFCILSSEFSLLTPTPPHISPTCPTGPTCPICPTPLHITSDSTIHPPPAPVNKPRP